MSPSASPERCELRRVARWRAGVLARVRGILLVILIIVAVLLLGFGIVSLIALPFGGMSLDLRIFWGLLLVFLALGTLIFLGRRRQKRAQAERAEEIAARSGGGRGGR